MFHTLVQLQGSRIFNLTIWPPFLYVYEDMIVYRKRSWFVVKEMSMTYIQVAQVNMYSGIWFSKLEIVSPTDSVYTMEVNYIPKNEASRAKRIIDQKVHAVNAHNQDKHATKEGDIRSYERSMTRLKELLDRKRITKREYGKRKREMIGKW